ncbi:MAG TPA: hypothetical protein VGK50_09015 [Coriobacteriia bacterium]|jgi:hypothetical protein
MASDATLRTIGRLIDGLYEGRDEIGHDEIYRRLESQQVAPEVMTYFAHLPDGDYTLDELVDEINGEIGEAPETGELGMLT